MTDQTKMNRPNVVLVLVDDMGFADLGMMGSEIKTPNLDRLAQNGVLLSSMYNCARCCPTRASLLTGLYPHRAGIGHMGADLGTPAYRGYLAEESVTIAEVLKANGYRTYMSGKWHVGGDLHALNADQWTLGSADHPTPRQRGFDRFYGIADGVTHFFSPHYILEDDQRVLHFVDDYYFTDAITDRAIGMIEDGLDADEDAPFFLYLAHAAPHWPLHALPEDIATYDGVYEKGWDYVRAARHEEMRSRQILQHPWEISPRDEDAPPWAAQADKRWEATRMAAYAAMIDRVDQSLGRLIKTLKRLDAFENTLILFLSDNGGCAELMAEDGWVKWFPDRVQDGRKIEMGNKPAVTPGGPLSYMSYDLPWANVSNAPFRLFKHWVHEGGISTPLIAHWPERFKTAHVAHEPCHVIDILPTIMTATGASYIKEVRERSTPPLDGENILPLLAHGDWTRERPIYWEHEGNCAVRNGNFKLVRRFNRPWELYDMEADRTELHDLSAKNRPMVEELAKRYRHWASSTGVLDWRIALPRIQAAWQMDDIHG